MPHQAYDWRVVLSRIHDELSLIKTPVDPLVASAYHIAIPHLEDVLLKMTSLNPRDLSNPLTWDDLYTQLHSLASYCGLLSYYPRVHKLFVALHDGIQGNITSRKSWNQIKSGSRDDTIQSMLQDIGGRMAGLDTRYYETFLPRGSGAIMHRITLLLGDGHY